ncbi:glycosyltransferase family 2 protein [Parvularcula sp. LCG005]|uniref:glycosyltransferase family 2 protein n=1 Tax=Parvularcula sp. LCG005 TaxID=3078805 RepID=UPI00294366AE|nr:glycosyltransferase family 2 protein [Parvularcula sp. LCG005]WOI53342.1 glycosyltransferase family 2 protein [Parvularcula sp. LCG005]
MTIAAIIVNYGTGKLILDHLIQIREELATVPGSHLYIVDNLSPNGDAALLTEGTTGMDDVTVIGAPRNGGFSYGNNRGFDQAIADGGYDHYYLLNPDAYPRPGCLKALLAFMAEHPKAGLVGSRLEGLDGHIQSSAFRFMSLESEFASAAKLGIFNRLFASKRVARPPQDEAHKTDWVCGASMLLTAEALEKVGLMDEKYFLYFEEVDFQRAIIKAGFEIWYVPSAHAIHLVGQSTDMKDGKQSAGTAPDYWYDSRRYYFEKNHGAAFADKADRAWAWGKRAGGLKSLLKGQGLSSVDRDIAGLEAARKRAAS